jgi:hypothetical protein
VKQILPVLFLFVWVILFPKVIISASSISTGSVPSSIVADQELTVDVVLTCSGCGSSYIRGVFFYPDSSTSYFGYTKNNSGEWVNLSGSPSSYFKVESGSWNGQMKFKFDSDKPAGDYYFKVGRYTASGTSFSQSSDVTLIAVAGSSPSLISTPGPTASPVTETPALTQTPTPTPAKSIYKINSVKDSDGANVSNIKIYVDGSYIHHYAPETVTFCISCYCDDTKEVSCDLGSHTIKLVKQGYADWSEQKTFNSGESFEVSPILAKIPTPTKTPTPTATKTPTPTSVIASPVLAGRGNLPVRQPGLTPSTESSSVLGDSTGSATSVIPDLSGPLVPEGVNSSPSNTLAPLTNNSALKYTFIFGLVSSLVSGGWLYIRHKKD